jgi:hypothetical protein
MPFMFNYGFGAKVRFGPKMLGWIQPYSPTGWRRFDLRIKAVVIICCLIQSMFELGLKPKFGQKLHRNLLHSTVGGPILPPMNKSQKDIILTGLIVVALMSLFPPWRFGGNGISRGYHIFVYAPDWGACVDLPRLIVQILFVAAVCAALCLLKADSKSEQ